jgi:hypothetical protein
VATSAKVFPRESTELNFNMGRELFVRTRAYLGVLVIQVAGVQLL